MRFLLIATVFLASNLANANVGIPVVSFGLPFMALNLAFVVLIEAAVIHRLKCVLKFPALIKQVFVANVITTFIGYPLVAVLEALTAVFGINLGWILPFPDLDRMNVYVSTAMFLTLVPCYFLSAWVESAWLKKYGISRKSVWIANLASYVFLTLQVYLLSPILLLGFGRYTMEVSYAVIMTVVGIFSAML